MSEDRPVGLVVEASREGHDLGLSYQLPPFEEQLDQVCRARMQCVEVHARWVMNPSPELTREACAARGLQVHSVHGAWGDTSHSDLPVNLGSRDAEMRRHSVDDVAKTAAYAGAVGARYLVIHPGCPSGDLCRDTDADALAWSIERLLPVAETNDVRLCLENLPAHFCWSDMATLVDFVESCGAPHLGICLDTGHSNTVASAPDHIRAAGRFLFTTHLHDNHGQSDEHLGPGEGTIDWNEVAGALVEIGYDGALILECPEWWFNHPENVDNDVIDRLHAFNRATVAG